ncbi:glycosyltransferase family 4 protein, partial [Endozoicomonas sp. ONNA1]
YVGSMVDYEGLDLLINATEQLRDKGLTGFKVLMVGDGAVKAELELMAQKKQLQDLIIYTGRVPHDEVEDYYSLIDICPFPRKGLPVCEMVSPLKPFEAMAMGKAVVSSDVAALAEIVQDERTGLLHKMDDAEDLADKLQLLIEQPKLREQYGQAAREWVVAERDWKVLAKRVDAVYKRLLSQVDDEKAA